ncbi:MAG TPA: M15 family metallopeptidase [Streptosporangiaceae bacterium]|nr:M15 family metallopeptidase [Streptosporangiaceae bacterium]
MQVRGLITLAVAAAVATVAGCGSDGSDGAAPPTASATAPAGTPAASGPATTASPPANARPKSKPRPAAFRARIQRIPSRSTLKYSWRPGCPVPISGLRLITMTYWGFDKRPHQGQLVVNARVADKVVKVFKRLYAAHYPIRRMELVDKYRGSDFDSIEADNTSAFNCRNATGSSSWSQHAFGLAIDLNPCENPYVTAAGGVAHKHCVKYRNRSRRHPAVIHKGDVVYRAFTSIGWGWGGLWSGARDYQHFSGSGR